MVVTDEQRKFIHNNKDKMTAQELSDLLKIKINTIRPHINGSVRKERKERIPPREVLGLHDQEPAYAEDVDIATPDGNFDIEKWKSITY